MSAIEPGARGEARLMVGPEDTALALGSGDVPVLGTPRLLALAEEATCAALRPYLLDGQTTVGMRVQLDHVQPSPCGVDVVAEAVLDKVEGRRLTFHVTVNDERGMVATARITRVLVDRTRFLENV